MRTNADIIAEMRDECAQEAVGCDAKAQWLWAQDLDEEAEDMVALMAMYQARERVLTSLLEGLEPVVVDPEPQTVHSDARPTEHRRPALTLHVNPGADSG